MSLCRVIVAGAGLAGLCAARELTRAHIEVVLVEAGARAGGRVRMVRFRDGSHGELGGEFIDGGQEAIRRLVSELGLSLTRVLRGGFAHRYRGAGGRYEVSRTRPWRALADILQPLLCHYQAAAGRPDAANVRAIARVSLREWLRRQHASPELHAMADALRGFFLAEPDDLSALPLVEQIADGGSPAQAEMFRIDGGTDRLVDALIAAAAPRLLTGHRLRAVTRRPDRAIAHVTDHQGRAQQLEADAVILTAPAAALRQVTITPPLVDAQQHAIERLRYGCATKVVVRSPRDLFGRRQARAFATDTTLGAFWDGAEGQRPLPGGLITFLGGGAASRALRDRADAGRGRLLDDLCWLGMAGAPIQEIAAYTWEDDPFAGGGYAYFDPGFDPAWRPLLGRRDGRLLFAGEHTSADWQGYMNGAVESGVHAARELLEKTPE